MRAWRRFQQQWRIPAKRRLCTGQSKPRRAGLIAPLLVGPATKIAETAASAGIDLGNLQIVDVPHSHAAATKAVELIREGKAEILMKGSLHTDELMGAVVSREGGLRTGRRISHVFVMDVPTYHKVLIVTDGAINIAPTLEDKVDICQNAIDLAISLGLEKPKVAILAAVETVTSKMPATIDAAALCKMAERGQIKGGILDGPLAFDNAISTAGRGDERNQIRRCRRSGHPARARSRSRQHPRKAIEFSCERRQCGHGPGRKSASDSDQSC